MKQSGLNGSGAEKKTQKNGIADRLSGLKLRLPKTTHRKHRSRKTSHLKENYNFFKNRTGSRGGEGPKRGRGFEKKKKRLGRRIRQRLYQGGKT